MNVPGYELIERIGEGGMATVWKARQVSLDRPVAIKILPPEYTRDKEMLSQFRREVEALAKLHHPGIIQIIDTGETEGSAYYIMEFIDGTTLDDLLARQGRLDEEKSLQVAKEVARALDYAWTRFKIIHCDIKPDNIMLDVSGRVKISDLGLVRFTGMTHPEDDEYIMGTPSYMSPEQARGAAGIDCRADMYSLGAMLYHLLTGRIPFAEYPDKEVLKRQVNDFIPDARERNPNLPDATVWLMEKLLAKDPDQRFTSWREMLSALAEVRQGRIPDSKPFASGQSTMRRKAPVQKLAPTSSSKTGVQPVQKLTPTAPSKSGVQPVQKLAPTAPSKSGVQPVKKPLPAAPSKTRVRPVKKMSVGAAQPAPAKPRQQRPENTASALMVFFILLAVTAAVYGIGLYQAGSVNAKRPQREAPQPSSSVPPRTKVVSSVPAERPNPAPPPAPAPAVARETVQPRPAPARPRERAPRPAGAWKNPEYSKAMKTFRRASRVYQNYLKDRSLREKLAELQPQVEKALDTLEDLKGEAPENVDMQKHIREGYLLLSNLRQSQFME